MSKFEGGKRRVRCVDCTKLSGKMCTAKNTSVAPSKRRLCKAYEFKGEYANREPLESVYVPYVDKNTRRLMKKLMKLGLAGPNPRSMNNPDESIIIEPTPGQIVLPWGTTATATTIKEGRIDAVPEKAEDTPEEEKSYIWTPDQNNE